MENKQHYINYYCQVIHFQIQLAIKFIRENKFPYQKQYWINHLKQTLIQRQKYIEKINSCFEPKQLELF
jgi:hypothetical protein